MVASIAPVHGLVTRIMKGVGEPELLIKASVSPHGYNLKPSDVRLLNKAQVVFWIGPALEITLVKPIKALAGQARIVSLMDDRDRGIDLLTRRKGGVFNEDTSYDDGPQDPVNSDPHIWLNPQNAEAMLLQIAEILSGVDPANANQYLSNALDGAQELEVLSRGIQKRLSDAKMAERTFIFFHDAYQYFEFRFGMYPGAVIQVDPDHAPGARRVGEIRTIIKHADQQSRDICIYSEPQYNPKLIDVLIEGTQARHATLDPIGVGLQTGIDFYVNLMTVFVDDFIGCINP